MTEKRYSYGIIPLYKSEQGIEVLLVQHAPDVGGHWSFPKGTPEKGESPIETARREVFEEVGLAFADIEDKTFSEEYTFEREGRIIEKTTTYYVGFADTKNVVIQQEEIAEAIWVPLENVDAKLTFPETKHLFSEVRAYIQK